MNRSFTHGPGIDEVLGMTDYSGYNREDYFFHHDGMGSIVNITDASEVLKTTYTYNPFGQFTTTHNDGTIDSPFTYAGREFSSTTGLFHNRAREYMPGIGQFTSRDPYPYDTSSPNTIQRYNYCTNSPTNFTDPMGLIEMTSSYSISNDNAITLYGPWAPGGGHLKFSINWAIVKLIRQYAPELLALYLTCLCLMLGGGPLAPEAALIVAMIITYVLSLAAEEVQDQTSSAYIDESYFQTQDNWLKKWNDD
jgi:RHS repeat-associated protein